MIFLQQWIRNNTKRLWRKSQKEQGLPTRKPKAKKFVKVDRSVDHYLSDRLTQPGKFNVK